MLLCEVALGKMKEVGISRNEEESEEEDEDDSDDKPLDLKRYQSRKGAGRRIPDPKHTISLNTGLFFKTTKIFIKRIRYYFRCSYATWSID